MTASNETLAGETRLALPVAIATMLSVVCLVGSNFLLQSVVGDGGDAEALREIEANSGRFVLSFAIQAIGFVLLATPLVYLFRAAAARNPAVRTQLIGVLYAAPLFLAAFAVLGAISTLGAATDFVDQAVTGTGEAADEAARDLINSGAARSAAAGFGLAGQLGLAVGMAYTCYQAMKVGLLTRFWGSLGAALGAVSFLFFQFALLWFIYLGLMVAGWVPGGRPPAWAAGRAIAWPRPGDEPDDSDSDFDDLDFEPGPDESSDPDERSSASDAESELDIGTDSPAPMRKRKRRS